jgi:regulator of extracellular matrix RemA (YlzA/DUF370 family)
MPTFLIGNIYVDAVKRLSYSAPLKVSSYPIEDGTKVANHVSEEDKTLTLDCTFADDALVRTSTSPIKGISRLMTAREKEQAIDALFARKELVDIVTHTKVYSSMLLIDQQSEVTAKNSKGYDVTLVFQEIQTVKTGTVAVPLDRMKKKTAAVQKDAEAQKAEEDKGKQEAPELTEAQKKKADESMIINTLFSNR